MLGGMYDVVTAALCIRQVQRLLALALIRCGAADVTGYSSMLKVDAESAKSPAATVVFQRRSESMWSWRTYCLSLHGFAKVNCIALKS